MSGIPAGAGSLLGKRLGKYEILALLALGGTAEIYLARIGGAAGFEKYVVVKCLHDHLADDQEFVKMFLDEARLAAHLDHSNIVQTMELGEHEDRYYMVMEFLAGLSLAMVVRRAADRLPGGRIPVPLVLNIVAQACAGLQYAHERAVNGKALNIVHRDISPQNLVVSFEGVVKVVDFGIAKAEQRETKTKSGTIKGKFAYMSPEQCIAANVDRRTDVFALGVIAHELLTGRRLFKRNSPYETYQSVIECAVERPSKVNVELDPALDDVIMKAVVKDKDERYQTAEAFSDALQSYLHHRGKSSGPGDVGRFFDANFAQEIEEHGARMRELISGRDSAADAAGWGEEEEEDKRRDQTVDLGGKARAGARPAAGAGGDDERSMQLDTADLIEDRPSSGGLSDVISDLGSGDDDDDGSADRTRIEANPLENYDPASVSVSPMNEPAAPATRAPQKMPPSGPLPLPAPPTGPVQVGAGPPGPPGAPGRATSQRFPNLSHLPTQVATDSVEPVSSPSPSPSPNQPGPAGGPNQSPANGAANMGYPQMSAEMSEEIRRSGNVFPSAPPRGRPSQGSPAQSPGGLQPPSGPQGAHGQPGPPSGPHGPQSGPHGQQSGPQSGQGPIGPPSGPHGQQSGPHGQPSGPHGPPGGPYGQPSAASLMSPVGQQYPQVDWAEAAAAPARALPPWMMLVVFMGAIGVALAITIIIAKIAR